MDGYNDNINQQQIDKLQQLFPEAVTEGKIDWQKLQATLGEAVDLGERYGLSWKGKSDVFAAIQEKTVQTLHPDQANSVDWDTTSNMFIEGDNLAALKILHKAYYGKVKMIYIDPPYNTGNDFIYNDDFKQTRRIYETEAGITDYEGNVVRDDGLRTNTGGHKHSNWLNMMYPRLFLARNLLRQDGVIFVSIDDNEVHNLRLMMNEIFGEENFVAQFPRITKRGGKSSDVIARNHDYILMFVRNMSECKLYPVLHNDEGFNSRDEFFESRGFYKLNQTLDYDSLGYVKTLDYPIEIDGRIFYAGGDKNEYEKRQAGQNRRADWGWRWSKSLYEFGKDNGFIVVKDTKNGSRIYTKTYQKALIEKTATGYEVVLKERTKPLSTLETTKNIFSNDNATKNAVAILGKGVFEYTKPLNLIKLLASISVKDGIVMDFFAGSGTTAHAVAELNAEDGGNRRWICVQLPELTDEKSEAYKAGYRTIADIARERIRRAGIKIRADQADKLASRDAPLDLGFRAYRVDDSNFKQWNELVSNPEEIRQQTLANLDPLEEGTTDDDLLTELLLKRGIAPLVKIEQHDGFCFIPSEKLAICLVHSMTEELFATILAAKPSSIILLDRAFGDDINLKVNLLLQAERQGVEVEVV